MKQVPLFLKFQETMIGNGFAVGITFDARVLVERGDDATWIYGVNPGAIAASGPDLTGALYDFRRRLRMYLFEVALDYPTFEEFKTEVLRFFEQADSEEEWEEARVAVRQGVEPLDGQGLTRETNERQPHVEVTELRLEPQSNLQPEQELPPALAA